jgi:hypothetical protein
VKHVGEPCAGEPHARFDGGWLETEPQGHRASRLPYQPKPQRFYEPSMGLVNQTVVDNSRVGASILARPLNSSLSIAQGVEALIALC